MSWATTLGTVSLQVTLRFLWTGSELTTYPITWLAPFSFLDRTRETLAGTFWGPKHVFMVSHQSGSSFCSLLGLAGQGPSWD